MDAAIVTDFTGTMNAVVVLPGLMNAVVILPGLMNAMVVARLYVGAVAP
jgi:hypothetical protein